jgi:hypothetical protein
VSKRRFVLRGAVGVELHPTMLDTAIRLVCVRTPPDDQALASFLANNSKVLAGKYRAEVVRLVTNPDRGPTGFSAEAAAAAFRVFPDDNDLVLLWSRWIIQGLFDRQERLIIKEFRTLSPNRWSSGGPADEEMAKQNPRRARIEYRFVQSFHACPVVRRAPSRSSTPTAVDFVVERGSSRGRRRGVTSCVLRHRRLQRVP